MTVRHKLPVEKFTFVLQRGVGIKEAITFDPVDNILKVHSLYNFITWTFLIDIGMIFSRYFRTWKYYLDIHALIFTMIEISNIVIISMTIYYVGPSQSNSLSQVHKILGIIFFSLTIFNLFTGIFVR